MSLGKRLTLLQQGCATLKQPLLCQLTDRTDPELRHRVVLWNGRGDRGEKSRGWERNHVGVSLLAVQELLGPRNDERRRRRGREKTGVLVRVAGLANTTCMHAPTPPTTPVLFGLGSVTTTPTTPLSPFINPITKSSPGTAMSFSPSAAALARLPGFLRPASASSKVSAQNQLFSQLNALERQRLQSADDPNSPFSFEQALDELTMDLNRCKARICCVERLHLHHKGGKGEFPPTLKKHHERKRFSHR